MRLNQLPGDQNDTSSSGNGASGLSDEQRDEYKRAFPEIIGNLDGIPSGVRDEVNRENLDILIGKLSGEDGERAKTQLDALRSIQQQLQTNAAK
jgi:hypothetical protein